MSDCARERAESEREFELDEFVRERDAVPERDRESFA